MRDLIEIVESSLNDDYSGLKRDHMTRFDKDRVKSKIEKFFKENLKIEGYELIIELDDNLLTVKVLDILGNLHNNSSHFKKAFNKFIAEFNTEDSHIDITSTQVYMFFVLSFTTGSK